MRSPNLLSLPTIPNIQGAGCFGQNILRVDIFQPLLGCVSWYWALVRIGEGGGSVDGWTN